MSSGAIVLRPATMQDAEMLLAWRNDPLTRASSHDDTEISLHSHLGWMQKVLADSSRSLIVAEERGEPVGSLRVDRGTDHSLLSWTVAPHARGRGVGQRMLAALVATLSGSLHAEIKAGNTASVRIAESVGMQFDREQDGILHFVRP